MKKRERDICLFLLKKVKEYPNRNNDPDIDFVIEMLENEDKLRIKSRKKRGKMMKKTWKEFKKWKQNK